MSISNAEDYAWVMVLPTTVQTTILLTCVVSSMALYMIAPVHVH